MWIVKLYQRSYSDVFSRTWSSHEAEFEAVLAMEQAECTWPWPEDWFSVEYED